jgi:peptide/nickel transport system substrate-binding protein
MKLGNYFRSFKRLLITAAAVFLLLPVAYAQKDSRPHITVAVNKLPRTLEPAEKSGNIEVRIHYSIFDTLLRRDFLNPSGDTFKLLPGLAKTWKRINEHTVEFTLRRGVKFHNGDTLTADDVVFTFSKERLIEDNVILNTGKRHFGHLKEVVKVDDHTVRFVTTKPHLLQDQKLAVYTAGIVNAR